MKIDVKKATDVASAAIERAWTEIEPGLMDEESNGAAALYTATREAVTAAFSDLTPWRVVGWTINGSQRYRIRDKVTRKYWCRKGSTIPVRYQSKVSAIAMCDRLNLSRLRNG